MKINKEMSYPKFKEALDTAVSSTGTDTTVISGRKVFNDIKLKEESQHNLVTKAQLNKYLSYINESIQSWNFPENWWNDLIEGKMRNTIVTKTGFKICSNVFSWYFGDSNYIEDRYLIDYTRYDTKENKSSLFIHDLPKDIYESTVDMKPSDIHNKIYSKEDGSKYEMCRKSQFTTDISGIVLVDCILSYNYPGASNDRPSLIGFEIPELSIILYKEDKSTLTFKEDKILLNSKKIKSDCIRFHETPDFLSPIPLDNYGEKGFLELEPETNYEIRVFGKVENPEVSGGSDYKGASIWTFAAIGAPKIDKPIPLM